MSQQSLPNHVGLILDGNRRWAKQQGLPTLNGHKRGSEVFKTIALNAFDRGVNYVSAFIFSTENWSRTKEEVKYIMGLVSKATEHYLNEFHERGIKIVILGKHDGLDQAVIKALQETESKTANNTKGTLALCFNYGGRDEMVQAVKKIVDNNEFSSGEISEQTLSQNMYRPEVPDIDLVIRTSGEQRLSGYMLWRAAYAEFLFTDTYWPAYTTEEFGDHLLEYAKRQRRFGG